MDTTTRRVYRRKAMQCSKINKYQSMSVFRLQSARSALSTAVSHRLCTMGGIRLTSHHGNVSRGNIGERTGHIHSQVAPHPTFFVPCFINFNILANTTRIETIHCTARQKTRTGGVCYAQAITSRSNASSSFFTNRPFTRIRVSAKFLRTSYFTIFVHTCKQTAVQVSVERAQVLTGAQE